MKYKKILLMLILTLFILTPFSQAALDRTDSLTREEQHDALVGEIGFWESIFGTPMSVYGTQRSCSNTANFGDGGNCLMLGDTSPNCPGLLQIYNKDGTPYKEIGREPTEILGGYSPGNYYVKWTAPTNNCYWYECFYCPAPPCRADSDCVNWGMGDDCGPTYRECSTEQATCSSDESCCQEVAGSKCGERYVYPNEAYTGTKKCSDDGRAILGEVITYQCAGECSSSISGYEVYEKCYLNDKVCEGATNPVCVDPDDDSICVDTYWSPSTSERCEGQSFIQYSNCGNERTAIGTRECTDPLPETEDKIIEEEPTPDNTVKILACGLSKTTDYSQKELITYTCEIENTYDTDKEFVLDVGVLPKSTAISWFGTRIENVFSIISSGPDVQCCEGQENIKDYKILLKANTKETFSVTTNMPYEGITDKCGSEKYWDGEDSGYVIYAYLTDQCGGSETDISFDSIWFKSEIPEEEKCTKVLGDACDLQTNSPGFDDSSANDQCESGWCYDRVGIGGQCAEVGTFFTTGLGGASTTIKPGYEPHPTCVELGTVKAGPSEVGIFDFLTNTFLGIPIFVWIIIGIAIAFIISKK